ncbi:hypothetical protein BSKO_01887 [Bryopsis sp. KO-2023]|nr:hypothetical protein BSKO_01887 [Bryopsis sp. KO-2023]
MADAAPAEKVVDGNPPNVEETAEEEECKAEFKPLVQLDEVETTTGEEAETLILELKCKLYRFDNGEWKERGVGPAKLLEHKETGKTRLLMREDKTLRVRANHMVLPTARLQSHEGNEKAWVFNTIDFADEEQKQEMFCIRFGNVEKAKDFQTHYETALKKNEELLKKDGESGEDPKSDDPKAEVAKLAEKIEETVKVTDEK